MKMTTLLLTAAAALFATSVAAQDTATPGANVSVVFDQELPNVPGKSMRAVLVAYEPGAGSPSHRHPSSAFMRRNLSRTVRHLDRLVLNGGDDRNLATTALKRLGFAA